VIKNHNKRLRLALIIALFPVLFTTSGCATLALTALSIGASTGLNHGLNGLAYKTFAKPLKTVKRASIKALGKMGVTVASKDADKNGEETILAKTKNRDIEILLEPISRKSTRVRARAITNNYLMDQATATEILIQTERVLNGA
jgi:hypothetical protein